MVDYEAIVMNLDAPTLVLAGPGAGKTYLLGDRVKRLLDNGVSAKAITVLTYSRDASQHMRNKLLDPSKGFGVSYDKLPHVATLHSLSYKIVCEKPRIVGLRKTGLSVLADEGIRRLLYRDASLIGSQTEVEAETALRCKQRGDCIIDKDKAKCKVCLRYWELMGRCNHIDFDDQVLFACRILESDDKILAKYRARVKHLLVDEYQDINAAQFRLIDHLSGKSREGLFVVGDDAQAIYGFRGADTRFILRFQEDFTGAAVPPLRHSWRCHAQTMNDAMTVLSKYYKQWTGPFDLEYHVQDGEPAKIWQLPSERSEAEWVARKSREAVSQNKTVLILAPKKEFFPIISDTLNQYGIPHVGPTSLLPPATLSRFGIVSNILQWAKNPNDSFATRVALEIMIDHSTMRVPGARKDKRLKQDTLDRRRAVEEEIASIWQETGRDVSLWEAFLAKSPVSDALSAVRKAMIELTDSLTSSERELQSEILAKLAEASGFWLKPDMLLKDIKAVADSESGQRPSGFGGVQLMTMRKAKGLEADIVLIVGLEDDLMPNPKSDLEEEARLFYVSMTRAVEQLYLFHCYRRPRNISYGAMLDRKPRSQFLEAIGRKSEYRVEKSRTK